MAGRGAGRVGGLVALLSLAACGHLRDGSAAPPAPGAAPAAADGWRPVADGVYFKAGDFAPGRQPDGNTLLLRGRTGWIVVDTGRHPGHAGAIVRAARASARPVVAIVNTHWHLDHVAGNALLRQAYPRAGVHASRRVEAEMSGFLARYRAQLETLLRTRGDDPQAPAWREERARIDAGRRLYPTRAVVEAGPRRIDGRTLSLGLVEDAVSGGDVWVFDPATRVLAAGDLVTLPAPLLDTACPAGWARALRDLDAQPFELLVPGHGEPMTRAQFQRYRRAYEGLLACAAGPAGDGECAAQWIDDLGDLLPPAHHAHARALLDYYLPQRLRGASPSPAYCPDRAAPVGA